MDLVLDPVQPRHQHRRVSEIGVRARIGEANLDALAVGRSREGMRQEAERLRDE